MSFPLTGGGGNAPGLPRGTQRIRGLSFKQEYSSAAQTSIFARMKARVNGQQRGRAPSMIQEAGRDLVPPKDPALANRITVVLDLDETLIYAREGPLYARPGLEELLRFLKDHCEAVVWTAGVKAYAQAVVRNIDRFGAIQHTVYRHRKWFSGQAGYNKDLSLLGRDLSTTLIIENTPDCVRGNETNGILVADYEGGELMDNTLPAILALLTDLIQRRERDGCTVGQYIQTSPLLTRQRIPTDIGDTMHCYCLDVNDSELFKLQKELRQNKDLPANANANAHTTATATGGGLSSPGNTSGGGYASHAGAHYGHPSSQGSGGGQGSGGMLPSNISGLAPSSSSGYGANTRGYAYATPATSQTTALPSLLPRRRM